MKSTNKEGFTLMELLIVVGIIGLLATFAAVSLGDARKRARDTKRVSDFGQIRKALELGFNQGDGFPVHASAVTLGDATHQVLCGKGTTIALQADKSAGSCDADKMYIGLIPPDPLPSGAYLYKGSVSSFCIQTVLEDGTEDFVAGNFIADQEGLRNGTCP